MDRIKALEVLVRVVDAGSLTGAAKQLGCAVSGVSRSLAALEREVGTPLIARSTRRLRPTPAGAQLAQQAREAMAQLDAALDRARPGAALKAQVTLSVPVSLGLARIVPSLPALHARHPHLQVTLLLDDRVSELVTEGIDIAVRGSVRPLQPSAELVAHPLGSYGLVLVASPRLLQGRLPERPEALTTLPFLGHTSFPRGSPWPLRRGEEEARVVVDGPLWCNDIVALEQAASAGMGATALPTWLAEPAIRAGRLLQLLPGWSLPRSTVHALHRRQLRRDVRIRSVVEHLTAALAFGSTGG